jgi:NmrA-like family protein
LAARAITRDPNKDKAKALSAGGAEVVQADLDDGTTSLKRAFPNGLKHVIWSTLEDTRKLMSPSDTRMPMLQEKYRVPHFDAKAEANAYFQGDEGVYNWAFPMGNSRMPDIAAEDIGKVAYGILKAGQQYMGKTVGIAAENLTFDEMSAKLSKALGIGPVKYTAVEPDAYRGFGFPGADELGNMFQVYRDFEQQVVGARSVTVARSLNPQLQTFDQWMAKNKSKIPV